MIGVNDTDYEAIEKIQHQLDKHEFLVDPDDTREILKRFEALLFDYESSQNDFDYCPECGEEI